jgi:hypothetical protein
LYLALSIAAVHYSPPIGGNESAGSTLTYLQNAAQMHGVSEATLYKVWRPIRPMPPYLAFQ